MSTLTRINSILEEIDKVTNTPVLSEGLNTFEKRGVNDLINDPGDGTMKLGSKDVSVKYDKAHHRLILNYKDSDVITLSLVDIMDARGLEFSETNKSGNTIFTIYL